MKIYGVYYNNEKKEISPEALETLIGKRWNLFIKEVIIDFGRFSIKVNDENVIRGE